MYRNSSPMVVIITTSLFFITSAFTCAPSSEAITGLKTGNKAPEIICDGMKGTCDPLSSLEGKVVLLEFWASTCDICRTDHFEMERMYQKFKDRDFKNADGFTVYSLAIDNNEEVWKAAIAEDRVSWKNQACDPRKWNAPSVITYEVNTLPKYFLLNGDGVIIDRYVDISNLEKILSNLSTN